jgi:voltage-dependent calcium channel L type alpha-1D
VDETQEKAKWWNTANFRKLRRGIRRARRGCRRVIKSQSFYWIVIVLVFLNTCVLSTEYHGQPEWLGDFQGSKSKVPKVTFNNFYPLEAGNK